MTAAETMEWREQRGLSREQVADNLTQKGHTVEPYEVARWEEGVRRVPEWFPRALMPPAPPPPARPRAPVRTVTIKVEAIGDDVVDGVRRLASFCRSLGIGDDGESPTAGLRRPWVAEITGPDPRYRLARQFIDGRKDYSEANSIGSRGVYIYYHLEPDRLYEVNAPMTWTRTDRYFCRVEAGQVVRMTEEEVLACLS